MGRNLQREFEQEPQVIMTTPLLEGLDGVQKMSKSLGNYIGIEEPPGEMFGKVMSISDELMWRWYELLTDLTVSEISDLRSQIDKGMNPRDAKIRLAKLIIRDFHSRADADIAEEEFDRRFVKREAPDEVEEKQIAAGTYRLAELLTESGLTSSKGEAKRLIEQGGVKVNGEKATAPAAEMTIGTGDTVLLQAGKLRFLRLTTG
jgi:tyrosyl-tRNA synthetase